MALFPPTDNLPPEPFTSQAFWDAFTQIQTRDMDGDDGPDDLEEPNAAS